MIYVDVHITDITGGVARYLIMSLCRWCELGLNCLKITPGHFGCALCLLLPC